MFAPDVVGEFAGWVCHYTPTIMSGPVFRWSPKSDTARRFEVSASREGVMVQGNCGNIQSGVSSLVSVLQQAARVYRILAHNDRDTDLARKLIKTEAALEVA